MATSLSCLLFCRLHFALQVTSRFERRKNGMSEAECSSECTIKDDVNKPKEQQATK
jgi:hypothetical protein